jgi:hypothetical protein
VFYTPIRVPGVRSRGQACCIAVLAVAASKVVAAVDQFADQVPNAPKPVTIDEADGTSPPLEELLTIDRVQTPIPIDRSNAGPRRDELPLGRDVMTFAKVRE